MVSEADDKIIHEIIDSSDFNHIVVESYINGNEGIDTAAYHFFARSQMPAGTAAKNEVPASIAEVAEFNPEKCTACLKCISFCPDSAIKAGIIPESEIEFFIEEFENETTDKNILKHQFASSKILPSEKGKENGKLIIAIDPYKCKGCSVCTDECEDGAFSLIKKDSKITETKRSLFEFFNTLPQTEKYYINDKDTLKFLLSNDSNLFTGGTNACAGCMEQIALKNLLNASGYQCGKENIGVINALSCSKNYTSNYPFNPFHAPCINTAPIHALSVARGLRAGWNRTGWTDKKLWITANEELWNTLSNAVETCEKELAGLKIFVVNRKRKQENGYGKIKKIDNSKKMFYRNIGMNDPETFYKEIRAANEFNGTVIIETYSTCPELN